MPLDLSSSKPASPRFIDQYGDTSRLPSSSAQEELAAGLLAPQASIAPKYFYNALGSRLFEAITALSEYYPTRTEASIFDKASADIAQAIAASGITQPCLIDLGAGNCAKSARLIPYLHPAQYVPVDISVDFLREAAEQIQTTFPMLDIVGIGMDFSQGLVLPAAVQKQDRVFFYPGSSLGNFSPTEALAFLRQISDARQGNARGLLLGIDLVKNKATLEAAYDDALGVTAAFNKNVLLHVNALMGADFDVQQWQHIALFNEADPRIEMHLQAECDLTVRWPGGERHFATGERIHTENSYKFTVDSMTDLLQRAGFSEVRCWTDSDEWFAVFWAAV